MIKGLEGVSQFVRVLFGGSVICMREAHSSVFDVLEVDKVMQWPLGT
jgi:hypothetical protein